MESFGVAGPPGEFNHIFWYQTLETFNIAVEWRPPYECNFDSRNIHKLVSEDGRKGIDEVTPNDLMICFHEKAITIMKRQKHTAWHNIRGINGPTYGWLNKEKCFWTLTKHGGRYMLVSIELVKKNPGKLWPRLMKDERESNRPELKWDKDAQKLPMIMDSTGMYVPSTFCNPNSKPKYELEKEDEEVLIEEVAIEDENPMAEIYQTVCARTLVDFNFNLDESTQAMIVSMGLDDSDWRTIQRERMSSDVFVLDIPFGGMRINFYLKGDEDSPILQGKLGGAVWRTGARWYVEQKRGHPVLELYLPKQTPEPWQYVIEGHHSLTRYVFDERDQDCVDGLWDEEAVNQKHLGDEYFRQSEYRAAKTCYDRVLERNPDSYVTLTNRAAAVLAFETQKFDLESVLEDAHRALEINPNWAKAKFREGCCYRFLKRFEEAIWAFEAGQRMDRGREAEWEDEIWKTKEDRIAWFNRKKASYLHDIE